MSTLIVALKGVLLNHSPNYNHACLSFQFKSPLFPFNVFLDYNFEALFFFHCQSFKKIVSPACPISVNCKELHCQNVENDYGYHKALDISLTSNIVLLFFCVFNQLYNKCFHNITDYFYIFLFSYRQCQQLLQKDVFVPSYCLN